jgi:excisionase family DNA binding protein
MPNTKSAKAAPNGAKHSPVKSFKETRGIVGAHATTQPPVGALKLKPAAQYLGGLSVPTMHRLIQRGLLRPCRATRHLLFPKKELDRFLMT